ncbi:MAG: carbonic anhydrase, partial [Bacteroidia bacterium]|nr:carbonic anhydrase [Bacteroidia bacterium]
MSDFYNKIIENNKNWVANNLKLDPEFFKKLSKTQTPPLL